MPLFSKEPSTRSIFARALALGFAAGLRAMTPIGMLARHQPDAARSAGWARWPIMRSGAGRKVLQFGWIGELIGDKLPMTPSRLQPSQMGVRISLGMIAGLAVGTGRHGAGPKIGGAVLGAAGAVAGSYGGFHARKLAGEASGIPDPAVAVVEDVAAAMIANAAVQG